MKSTLSMICGAAALMFVWGQAAGQSPPSGLACVAEMTVPVYSGLPWLARVTGEARVSITVGRNGIPDSIDVESPAPGMTAWLRSAMAAAKFLNACAGQTVEMRFVYRLVGDPEDAPHYQPRSEVTLKAQNTFEISAPPPIARPQP